MFDGAEVENGKMCVRRVVRRVRRRGAEGAMVTALRTVEPLGQ
jgi:hypothetical protein